MGRVFTKKECEEIIRAKRDTNVVSNPILTGFENKNSIRYEKGGIDCGARYSRYSKIAPGEDDPTC